MKKINNNQQGFTAVEGLLIVVIVALIGVVGWFVYKNHNKTATNSTATTNSSATKSTPVTTPVIQPSTTYSFKQLGISMDILPGWKVTSTPTTQEGVNFYTWTVAKTGADGKVSVNSTGFRGGFEGCNGPGSLTPAAIKDVTATNNSSLMFMSWSYNYSSETTNSIGIVRSDETIFKTTNNPSATAVANKDVKAGNYYFCITEPLPGFSLNLNSEVAPSFSRKDSVKALSSSSSDTKYVPLASTAQSYADIKTMLVTIK